MVLCAATSRADAGLKYVECGGFRLPYETSIASTRLIGTSVNRISSVIAVAAVTSADGDLHVRAWMVWDERAFAWLAIAKNSPVDLKRLWIYDIRPRFAGPGIQLQFTPLQKPLPKAYRLTDCPHVLPYGK